MNSFIGLVYISEASEAFDTQSLQKLLVQSSMFNNQLSVTGYLYFDGQYFLQYLEGQEDKVNTLMDKIKNDTRHNIINVIVNDGLEKTCFPKWGMRYLDKASLVEVQMEQLVIKYVRLLSMRDFPYKEDMHKNVWSMIETLSMLRFNLEKQQN